MVIDPQAAATEIISALRSAGDEARAVAEKRYLKSELEHFGSSVPAIRKATTGFLKAHPKISRSELVRMAAALWSQPIHECRMAAVECLAARSDLVEPRDVRLVERMIRESKTWALVDGLATTIVGNLVVRRPELNKVLDRWAEDNDFWLRRSALLALLKPLRAGAGDFDRFARYADSMLEEREFFVRKAIGWVLRETSKKRPQLVFDWLLPRAGRASGVTVREAVKYLPPEQTSRIIAVYERGR
jgi:3-methyladenine DNA glycosylase AlkD